MNAENSLTESALVVAVIFPFISAATLRGIIGGNYVVRLFRAVIGYVIVLLTICVGFMSQGVWGALSDSGRYASGWDRMSVLIHNYSWAEDIPNVIFVASVTTFLILMQPRKGRISVIAFRAVFVVLAFTDILTGMIWGYQVSDYLTCMIFDFIGSLIFAAIIPIFVERLIGEGNRTRSGPNIVPI